MCLRLGARLHTLRVIVVGRVTLGATSAPSATSRPLPIGALGTAPPLIRPRRTRPCRARFGLSLVFALRGRRQAAAAVVRGRRQAGAQASAQASVADRAVGMVLIRVRVLAVMTIVVTVVLLLPTSILVPPAAAAAAVAALAASTTAPTGWNERYRY